MTADALASTSEFTAPDFTSLDLPEPLLAATRDLGYLTPSPIQAQAIPALLAGRDITGVAQTGTGKTAAFGLPLLATVDPATRGAQALVLTPTRELALQVATAISGFATHLDDVEVVAIYGGAPYLPQQRALAAGAQVVVGTPGRVIDHISRGTLDLSGIRYLVLDEADEMLRMGFAEDVDQILTHAPGPKQVALFSATMPPAIRKVADGHLNDPVEITVTRPSTTVSAIRQTYAIVPFRHKNGALLRVLATTDAEAAIVFTRTRGAAEDVGSALIERGVSAATISGDVAQKEREKIVERLRTGALDVLVATDVAARGLDVERIGLVVNFDLPGEPEAYVHRIGRTGRAGRTGTALTFVTPNERGRLRGIERHTRTRLEEISLPSPADVSAHRARALLDKLPARVEAGRLDLYTTLLREHLERTESNPVEATAALIALAVGDDGPRAREEQERYEAEREYATQKAEHEKRDNPRKKSRRDVAGTRYRLSVGRNHGVAPAGIVGALTGEAGLNGSDVGRIDIFPSFSLVDISVPLDQATLDRLGRAKVAGRALHIAVDEGAPPRRRVAGKRNDRPGHGSARGQDRGRRGGQEWSRRGHEEARPRFRSGREQH